MKIVLFDLGRTLEENDILFPGAQETLANIQRMSDKDGKPFLLGLISDFIMPSSPDDIPAIQNQYYQILDLLGIRSFFEPVAEHVTLSTEVGVFKPDERIFRRALDKVEAELQFRDALFITENGVHVAAARALGMGAIHFRPPGQAEGDVDQLIDLPHLIEEYFQIPTAREIQRKEQMMSIAISTRPTDSRKARSDPAGCIAANWVQFGDEVLLFNNLSEWNGMAQRAGRRSSEVTDMNITVKRQNLHLVIQKGRLFERANPDVKVVHDRGRFLVVDLDPETARELENEKEPCYVIRPIDSNQVVFEKPGPSAERRAPQAWIQELVDRISATNFHGDLLHLASFPTRHSSSPEFLEAANWARNRLSLGYETRLQNFTMSGGTSLNVIAEKRGNVDGARDVILICAHLDSINHEGGDAAIAPGADDNGSGSAGLLQIADALRDHESEHDVRFILTGGEEQGLFGSQHYIENLTDSERGRIKAVVNMDMIGLKNTERPTVLLEGHLTSQDVIKQLMQAAETFAPTLGLQTSLIPFASDHVPFINAGIPAVLTIEGVDSASEDIVHSDRDTADRISDELAVQILRMNVAFVAGAVGIESS